VRTQFNYALDLMNSAVDGAPLPPYQPPGAAPGGYGAPPPAQQQQQPSAPYSAAAAELTLKDLVQRFAEEAGVDFLPKPGRFVDGQPVFSFGSVSVLLDAVQGTIRAQIRDRWAPVSLERLLQEQQSRAGGAAR
jgi:tuftelin-interacting protein 11